MNQQGTIDHSSEAITAGSAPVMSLGQYALLVGAGAFATTFAQLRVIGSYPLTFLLKEHYALKQEQVAVFFFWATFAWNLKPLAGIFTDAIPFFGTRRRHYMLCGSLLAAIGWLLMGVFHRHYSLLIALAILLNVAMVFSSTVMGGLMVEAGQAFKAPGRISSLRQVAQSVSQILAPLLGGYLAGCAFGWTAGISAACLLALAGLAFIAIRERPLPSAAGADRALTPRRGPDYRPSPQVLSGLAALGLLAAYLCSVDEFRNFGLSLIALAAMFLAILLLVALQFRNVVVIQAQHQLVQILQSRTLWMAVGMLFLIYTVPGLYTALTYRQIDILKFDKRFIGTLSALEAASGVLAALGYGLLCKRFSLRTLLMLGVALNAACTLLFLFYTAGTALSIHVASGLVVTVSELALMQLAVCSTPKGCEALGFALMMSIRNFGIGISDVLGSKLMDQYHFGFNSLVVINAATTAAILLLVPLLPAAVLRGRDGKATS